MTVGVVGLGRVGLPTALLLAQEQSVVGLDTDEALVRDLNNGEVPFDEQGVRDLYDEVEGSFVAVTTADEGRPQNRPLNRASKYVIATPTPLEEKTGVADLHHVRSAAETVASALDARDVVILESTVPPGTAERVIMPILEQSGLKAGEFGYAYSPERALPGRTVYEMKHNDRIIGGIDADSHAQAERLYDFVKGELHTTDVTTAEFVKLLENTYRDVNIALANEIATIAENYGVDGHEAIGLANNHPRVDLLNPGPGVGGHCIPIDSKFLNQTTNTHQLISVARELNELMPIHTLRLVRETVDDQSGSRLAVLGVAYKGDVGDTRNTPALRFLQLAENEGYAVSVHDPHVDEFEYEIQSLEGAVTDADCLVIVTDHASYTELDVERLGDRMRNRAIVDARGIIDPERWENEGFTVSRLGDGSQ